MKIGFMRGHNTIYNGGAVGIKPEEDMINETAMYLIPFLRKLGHKVIDCTPTESEFHLINSTTDSLKLRCNKANQADVDLVISLHFNYFNGSANGSEIYYKSEAGKSFAESILPGIVNLGFANRGVKYTSSLYVINHTIAPAILIEGCFCDSPKDISLYNPQTLATAIAEGLPKSEDKLIIAEPTASMKQISHWAESNFKDASFNELLYIYYPKCVELGVNPVVLFSQMSLETGFLYKIPSNAGIDASYHNPCGLKTTEGGSSTDPNAHAKFESWDIGIQAHLDHLGLYLGLPGYPKSSTPDPRHFPYLLGTVSTVEDLGNTWTSSETYSDTIIKFCTEIENTTVDDNLEDRLTVVESRCDLMESEIKDIKKSLALMEKNISLILEKLNSIESNYDKFKTFINEL